MASVKHQVEYLAARVGLALAGLLTARGADRLGVTLGRFAHAVLAGRRNLARDNLRQAFTERLSESEIEAITRRVFENIGRTLMELARFHRLGPEGLKRIVDEGDVIERVNEVLKLGHGALMVSAHFGNWEIVGTYPPLRGIPTDIVVLTQHNAKVNELILNLRGVAPHRVFQVPANTRGVFKALKENRLVIMAADQHASTGTLVMDFFGRPATIFRGPALFAARCGSPIIPALLLRERYDRHRFLTGEAIIPPNSGDEEADVRMMTEKYIHFLEEKITEYPDQWLWTHNRWKLKANQGNLGADIS